MSTKDFTYTDCPLEYASNIIGGKWKLKILWSLSQSETIRYNTLKKQIQGITDLMLTKSLKDLIQANVVLRNQYNEIPPRVEYSLTPQGVALIEALVPITNWSKESLTKLQKQ